ncbi:hypothetical protein HK103_005542 [Boothiomyces macroporosus]|uniref:HMG box domain-containing protein n=1 Tax=Boothiomyces macroporosus TaxID=261099 RepID=A0AAD5Y7S6_9FUNG|nr:hypothetical protein HK103_005542 [Boothiomyces macroporosus]
MSKPAVKESEKIKALNARKPMNAFFRYKAFVKDKIVKQYNTRKNSEIAAIASSMWKKESHEIRQRFIQETEKAYEQHKKDFPGYIWPSKNSKLQKEKLKAKLGLEPKKVPLIPERLASPVISEGSLSVDQMSMASFNDSQTFIDGTYAFSQPIYSDFMMYPQVDYSYLQRTNSIPQIEYQDIQYPSFNTYM